MTEFIRECILIIDREKENGTLTDAVGKEMIEFLNMTCGYFLKNKPELKKDVYGIMRPVIMTQMERAEYEIGEAIRKLILRDSAAGVRSRRENGEVLDVGK